MNRGVRSILLVDGSASILFSLGILLRRLEYKIQTARSAEEALRMMEDALPSIVVTDISLPNMSGTDLLKRMKDAPVLKAIPVVLLTAENDPGIRETCSRLGCTAYLVKPVEPEALFRTLQAVSESIPREHIRLKTSLKVIVGDGSVTGGAARTEFATAISEGGLYVRTLYPQPQNALTPIRVFLPNRVVSATAVVLYSFTLGGGPFKEPGMGMKFVEISDADRGMIRRFIKDQLTGDIVPQGEHHGSAPVQGVVVQHE